MLQKIKQPGRMVLPERSITSGLQLFQYIVRNLFKVIGINTPDDAFMYMVQSEHKLNRSP